MTASSEAVVPRANRDGHPCPPWCAVDHDKELFPGYYPRSHGGESLADLDAGVSVRACLRPSSGVPDIQVSRHGRPGECGSFYVAPGDAGPLAALLEQLAGATPEQHRELAAAIRAAANLIKGDGADEDR